MNPSARLSRRQALAMLGTAGATALTGHSYRADAAQPASALGGALTRNDAAVRTLLATQISDTASASRGSVPVLPAARREGRVAVVGRKPKTTTSE